MTDIERFYAGATLTARAGAVPTQQAPRKPPKLDLSAFDACLGIAPAKPAEEAPVEEEAALPAPLPAAKRAKKPQVEEDEQTFEEFLQMQAAAASPEPKQGRVEKPRAGRAPRPPASAALPALVDVDDDADAEKEEEEEEEEEEPVGPPLELRLPDPQKGALLPRARAMLVPGAPDAGGRAAAVSACVLTRRAGDIASALKPFQAEGVRFLHARWCCAPGCVLGDDMVR